MKARKLLRNFLITGLIAITGCSPSKEELSLPQIVNEMDGIRRIYTNNIVQVDSLMEGVLARKNFSQDEQNKAYTLLEEVVRGCARYNVLASKCPEITSRLEFPTNRFNWYPILERNVMDFDGGDPEIEKHFSAQVPGFQAEGIYSEKERQAAQAAMDLAIDAMYIMLNR